MLSKFFLDRPVFAWVIAIVMMLAGGLAIYNLPISQYPPIAPPSIAIDAFYPGASAETVENSVTQIIEQKMTGFDKMLYLSATSDSSGAARIELTFAPGTDPDLAWAKVQNKLQLAMASLPEVVQRQGVKVSKSTRNYLHDRRPDLGRRQHGWQRPARTMPNPTWRRCWRGCRGWGRWRTSAPSMPCGVWLNPDKLTDYSLTIEDVIAAAAGLQRGGVRRPVRRRAGGGRPAAECLHHRPEPAQDPGGVCRHSPAHQPGRLHRARQGCGADRAGHRALRHVKPVYNGKPPAPWPSGRPPAPMRWIRPMPSGPKWRR